MTGRKKTDEETPAESPTFRDADGAPIEVTEYTVKFGGGIEVAEEELPVPKQRVRATLILETAGKIHLDQKERKNEETGWAQSASVNVTRIESWELLEPVPDPQASLDEAVDGDDDDIAND